MKTLNYFIEDDSNHKPILKELNFIGEFIQDKVKHRFFLSWTVDMDNTYQNIATILEDY